MSTHYHLIGIGGIGMSAIAQLLLRRGIKVSGSDLKESRITAALREMGIEVSIGHAAANLKGADTVVYSSAIKADNPEMQEALRRGLVPIKRAEALAGLMQDRTVITVTGSHGKTTTSSLVSYLLLEAGLCPSLAVGGIIRNIDNNACLGEGKFFVAEADESDGSFLYYRPDHSIITNIDREHLDYYKDFAREAAAFGEFIARTREGGCVYACGDDPVLRKLCVDSGKRHVFFGLHGDADVQAKEIQMEGLSSEFECVYKGVSLGRFALSLGGLHNVSNALAAIALGMELGVDLGHVRKALADYQGAHRRLEVKFSDAGFVFIDDYAHHPTEIKATLKAVQNLKARRVIAVFQPHRYSRTRLLFEDFAQSFDDADRLIVTDIYAASETPLEGVHARALCERIREYAPQKETEYLRKDEIVPRLIEMLEPGDLVITLGAGDIVKVCDELAVRFGERHLRRQGL